MAGALKVYRVQYCFTRGGQVKSEVKYANVAATAGDENTIKTVLSNNSIAAANGEALQILSIRNGQGIDVLT